jgi:D-3-phosphoglycerate dehydrogenase
MQTDKVSKMKILFIDTAHPVLKQMLESAGHHCVDGSKLSREELLKMINEYDGVMIRSRILMDATFIDKAVNLKFIARAGAGMESIDVGYAITRKITCINSPEGSKDAVGEHAVAMLLALLNKINKADREVRDGKWIREDNRGTELKDKTVGIVGYGNMGKSFAKKISGFDCHVLAFDKYLENYSDSFARESTLEGLFEKADIISLHIPLTDETTFWADKKFFQQFKKNIFIINTARGRILKTGDLAEEMKAGKILGACLDVNEYEDTSFEKSSFADAVSVSPAWNYLLHSDRVVFSPHIAGWTFESNEKIAKVLAEKILKLFPN